MIAGDRQGADEPSVEAGLTPDRGFIDAAGTLGRRLACRVHIS